MRRGFAGRRIGLIALTFAAAAGVSANAQISFGTAVDLALRNSQAVAIAEADQAKALAVVSESKDIYIPSLTFASGLAYTNGFPIGDPSVVRFALQGLVANFSQPQYVRAAAAGYRAATFSLEDARQQVVLDAAQSYAELDATVKSLAAMKDEEGAAQEFVRITQDRVDSGVQAKLDSKKAQLRAAQVRLRRLDLAARADVLREHLGMLTGIRGADFITDGATIPHFPAAAPADGLQQQAVESSAVVKSAYELAKSRRYQAKGDHKIEWHPEVDLVVQYGYFSNINNYSEFYQPGSFRPSNAALGVQITVPIFSMPLRAKARESDADAVRAEHQATLAASQVSEHVLQLVRAVDQTDAAAEVARLQHEISSADLDSVQLRASAGSGAISGNIVTPNETAGAQIEERGLYVDYLNAEWHHTQAELSLMRAIGTLQDWAKTALTLTPATHP